MTFDEYIGMEHDDEPVPRHATVRILPHHCNPTGGINGGLFLSMADNLSTGAANRGYFEKFGERKFMVGVDLHAVMLANQRGGTIRALSAPSPCPSASAAALPSYARRSSATATSSSAKSRRRTFPRRPSEPFVLRLRRLTAHCRMRCNHNRREALSEATEVARTLIAKFDALDFEGITAMGADDMQGVDEISRKWIRGKDNLSVYFGQLKEMGVSDVHSELSDLSEITLGEGAIVTGMMNQQYRAGGEQVKIVAPLTIGLRKQAGAWKVVLVNAVPLSEEHS